MRPHKKNLWDDFSILADVDTPVKKLKWYLKHNFCIHRYNKRGNINLHTPSCYTVPFQKSIVNMGVKLYSRLPERIKTSSEFKLFKNKEHFCS
jgi:hypothetical protein